MNTRTRTSGLAASCAALCLVWTTTCGGDKADDAAAKVADDRPATAKPATKPDDPVAANAADSGGEKIDGKATLVAGSKPGAESPLRLVVAPGGRLGGSLSVDGAECVVAGMVDEAVVRGWLRCPAAGAGAPPRRGTLIGEKAGDSYTGTFAISDDGAASVLSGTWKAGK